MDKDSNLNSQDVIKRAQELLDEDNGLKPEDSQKKELREGSYENESFSELDDSHVVENTLETPDKESDKKFNIPKLGYKRVLHFKMPSFFKIFVGIIVIIILLCLISLMLPYIPPVL